MTAAAVTVPIDRPRATGGHPTAWWGMLVLITTEAMIFIGLLSTYFFLRATSSEWPLGGLELPELKITSIFSVVLIGSSIPVIFGERAIERNRVGALKIALALAWLMGAAFLYRTVVDFQQLRFGWRDNAYASIYYTTIGLHALHVLAGLAISAVVQTKVWLGRIDGEHHISVDVFALYWHFVDVVWIFVFMSLIVSPHLGR